MSKTYSYKKLPTFNPDYYHSWASDVQSAFAERNWTAFLDITNDTVDDPKAEAEAETETSASRTEHATSLIQAFAFINQCIPYEHKTRIRNCTTAAQIWQALKEEYASQTREDELGLEGILPDFKKSPSDSLNTHIAKFSNIIGAVVAQQPDDQQYNDTKINRYFLCSLEPSTFPTKTGRDSSLPLAKLDLRSQHTSFTLKYVPTIQLISSLNKNTPLSIHRILLSLKDHRSFFKYPPPPDMGFLPQFKKVNR